MRRAAVALLRAARTQGSYPAPLQASVVSAALLANPPLPRPVHNRSWASASAADGGSTESAADTLAPCERQPEKQQANELDERLAAAGRAGDTPVVLATVEAEGERFGELNVVSALSALGEAAERNGGGGMSPEEVKRSPAFQALVDMVLAGMMRFPPGLLAEAVHSCGKLGASEEFMLDEVGRHLMRHVDDLSADDVTHLVTGFAALDHAPSSVLFEALAARAEATRTDFSEEQRQAVAAAYEALGYGSKAPRF